MRAAWHRLGSLSLISSGVIALALWQWLKPESVNPFQVFGCATAAVMFGWFWLLLARAFGRLESRRPPHRYCRHCGGDLTGSFAAVCRACGAPVER